MQLLQWESTSQQENFEVLMNNLERRFGHSTVPSANKVTLSEKKNASLLKFEAEIRCLIHLEYPGELETFQEEFTARLN